MNQFILKTFPLGDWMTNSYFLGWEPTREAWIVDPGFSPEPLIEYIKAEKWEVKKILLTHAHLDHIAGISAVREVFPQCEILVHSTEKTFLTDPSLNLSSQMGMNIISPDATATLSDGDMLTLGEREFRVIHTPGHSPGGCCFYQAEEKFCLVGDSLFQGSVGRTDFPTSNGADLARSIKDKLYVLPEETVIHPGHGPASTIGFEGRHNPFVQA